MKSIDTGFISEAPKPSRTKSTFVSRERLMELQRSFPAIDPDKFFSDIDEVFDPYFHDPFERCSLAEKPNHKG